VLEIKPRALCTQGELSTTELYPKLTRNSVSLL
jgi:hypothetical protein